MKYKGKYNLKRRLLSEAKVEWGGTDKKTGQSLNIPDEFKVFYDSETFEVFLSPSQGGGVKKYNSAASARAAARMYGGKAKEKWGASQYGGSSGGSAVTSGDDDITFDSGGNLSSKSGASHTLAAPINVGELAAAQADPAEFAKQFVMDSSSGQHAGKILDPNTGQLYGVDHYDFSKAVIKSYGKDHKGNNKFNVVVPAK